MPIAAQVHQLSQVAETTEVIQKKNHLKTQKEKIDVHLTGLAQELYNLRSVSKVHLKFIHCTFFLLNIMR